MTRSTEFIYIYDTVNNTAQTVIIVFLELVFIF